MQEREVRMRTIESLSTMGVRAASEMIRQANEVVTWVMAGEDTPEEAPTRTRRKTGDKGDDTPS